MEIVSEGDSVVVVKMKFSTIMNLKDYLEIISENKNITAEFSLIKEYSDTLTIHLKNVKEGDTILFQRYNHSQSSKCYSKHNLDLTIFTIQKQADNYVSVQNASTTENSKYLLTFLNEQLSLVEDLITCLSKSGVFSEFAHFRKSQLLSLILNLYYNTNFEVSKEVMIKQKEIIEGILKEYEILKNNLGLRMNVMYQSLYESFNKEMERVLRK